MSGTIKLSFFLKWLLEETLYYNEEQLCHNFGSSIFIALISVSLLMYRAFNKLLSVKKKQVCVKNQ